MLYPDGILNILGKSIKKGESAEAKFSVAKLHTNTTVDVPVIIHRAKKPGPTVLFTAGIHGDEVNGVEIVRQLISKGINKPKIGTIICMPVINIFGFINLQREFPDGRDLNRMFPGSKTGSLGGRVAHHLMTEVIPKVDYILDFHTGGANRFNAAQIRIQPGNSQHDAFASIFGAPFVLYSKNIKKTFRNACNNLDIPVILYEGGKSLNIDKDTTKIGVEGSMRFLNHLEMLADTHEVPLAQKPVFIEESKWLRAKYSGMFKSVFNVNSYVEKGQILGFITDPFGKLNHAIKSNHAGYLINVNETPIVYQGDALFHVSSKLKDTND